LSKGNNIFKLDKPSLNEVIHSLLVRWENFSSFGCEGLACELGQPNVLKCAAGKKKLKMRVGKNFKNIWVGLCIGKVWLVCVDFL